MRVSIVATSLDGHRPESKTVLNMVNRIQNRNPGYSDNIFKNPNIEQNPISSIDGATALKLDEQLEIDTTPSNTNQSSVGQEMSEKQKISQKLNPKDISMENASYIENNIEVEKELDDIGSIEEDTPKLFSEDGSQKFEEVDSQNEKLFNQTPQDDEEFEIPAF